MSGNGGASPPALPEQIGPYRILRLIDEGGMGAVYEAQQQRPKRVVALKVIRGGLVSPARLRRFEREAEALGRLQHPGIARIYEAGAAGIAGQQLPYFAMELIRGGLSLTRYVQTHQLDLTQRLELLIKIAQAVHYAHQQGVIHRDLKPDNILVGRDVGEDCRPEPKVLDFGVARITDADVRTTTLQTDVGQLVGTLRYMSPEQAAGDPSRIDARSDVYALGVLGYELIAGRLPYVVPAQSISEAVRVIQDEEPTRLSTLVRSSRGDVETIIAKALAKNPAERYATAGELAEDLGRHLRHEVIVARPPSLGYRVRKFTRRHKALVASVTAVNAALAVGLAGAVRGMVQARRAEQRVAQQAQVLRRTAYNQRIALASNAVRDGRSAAAAEYLNACDEDLRGWEWRWLRKQVDQSQLTIEMDTPLHSVAFSSDGKRFFLGKQSGEVHAFDAASGERLTLPGNIRHDLLLYAMEVRPDGTMVTCGYDHHAVVWNLETGEALLRYRFDKTIGIRRAHLSSDGRTLTALGHRDYPAIYVVDVESGAVREIPTPPVKTVDALPDHNRVFMLDLEGVFHVWDLTGKELARFPAPNDRAKSREEFLAVSPDASLAAYEGRDQRINVVATADGQRVADFLPPHDAQVGAIVFSPDGCYLAASHGAIITVWSLETFEAVRQYRGHTTHVWALGFSPTGDRLLSVAQHQAKLWAFDPDRPDGMLVADNVKDITYWTMGMAPTPDGRRVAYIGYANQHRLIEQTERGYDFAGFSICFGDALPNIGTFHLNPATYDISADGRWYAWISNRGIAVWELGTPRWLHLPPVDCPRPVARRMSRRGAWNDLARVERERLDVSCAFLPGTSYLFSVSDHEVHKWDVESGELLAIWRPDPAPDMLQAVAARGGDRPILILGGQSGHWAMDANTGQTLWHHHWTGLAPEGTVMADIAFSSDGARVAIAAYTGEVAIRDVATGESQRVLRSAPILTHSSIVRAVAWSPDGQRLAAGDDAGQVEIWNPDTGERILTLSGHRGHIIAARWLDDGRLLTAGWRGPIRVWDPT